MFSFTTIFLKNKLYKLRMKAAMKMAGLVPSTIGTLMSSGILEGGKALKGITEFGALEMVIFLQAFAAGIQKRGKCQPGDCIILDAMLPFLHCSAGFSEWTASVARSASAKRQCRFPHKFKKLLF